MLEKGTVGVNQRNWNKLLLWVHPATGGLLLMTQWICFIFGCRLKILIFMELFVAAMLLLLSETLTAVRESRLGFYHSLSNDAAAHTGGSSSLFIP